MGLDPHDRVSSPVTPGPAALGPQAVRNAVVAVAGRVTSIVVAIVLTPIVLGGLGRELYGVVSATGSVFEYLILLRGGLGSAMRRFVTIRVHSGDLDGARRHYQAGFWWGVLLRIPILLAGLILAEPLCRFLRLDPLLIPAAASGVRLLIIAAVVVDTSSILEVPTYATGNTAWIGQVRAGASIVRLVLIVAAFRLLGPTLTTYSGTLIVVELLGLSALGFLAARVGPVGSPLPRWGLGDSQIRGELFRFGRVAILVQIASLFWLSTDNLLIGRLYGAGAVTLYNLGARWMPIIRGLLTAMTQSLTPLFTRLEAQAGEERTRKGATRAVAATSALAVPACLVPCVVGDLFLVHWVGEEYRSAYLFLLVTLAPLVLDLALMPIWSVLQARGRIEWVATGEILVALGNVAISLTLALGLGLGLLGFSLGNTAALLARSLLLGVILARGGDALPSLPRLLAPLGRALLGGAPGIVLLYFLRSFYGGSLTGVIGASLVGGVVVLAGSSVVGLKPAGLRYLAQSARDRRGGRS